MVKEVEREEKKYFQCEVCEFFYETRELAQKCEDFCNDHQACSVEITKHAVSLENFEKPQKFSKRTLKERDLAVKSNRKSRKLIYSKLSFDKEKKEGETCDANGNCKNKGGCKC